MLGLQCFHLMVLADLLLLAPPSDRYSGYTILKYFILVTCFLTGLLKHITCVDLYSMGWESTGNLYTNLCLIFFQVQF